MHLDVMHSQKAIEVSQGTENLPASGAPEMCSGLKEKCMYRLVGDRFCKPLGAASNVLDGGVVKMYVGCIRRHP